MDPTSDRRLGADVRVLVEMINRDDGKAVVASDVAGADPPVEPRNARASDLQLPPDGCVLPDGTRLPDPQPGPNEPDQPIR